MNICILPMHAKDVKDERIQNFHSNNTFKLAYNEYIKNNSNTIIIAKDINVNT